MEIKKYKSYKDDEGFNCYVYDVRHDSSNYTLFANIKFSKKTEEKYSHLKYHVLSNYRFVFEWKDSNKQIIRDSSMNLKLNKEFDNALPNYLRQDKLKRVLK